MYISPLPPSLANPLGHNSLIDLDWSSKIFLIVRSIPPTLFHRFITVTVLTHAFDGPIPILRFSACLTLSSHLEWLREKDKTELLTPIVFCHVRPCPAPYSVFCVRVEGIQGLYELLPILSSPISCFEIQVAFFSP